MVVVVVFFAGALACLELGPASFNLAGARTAARFICRAIAEQITELVQEMMCGWFFDQVLDTCTVVAIS